MDPRDRKKKAAGKKVGKKKGASTDRPKWRSVSFLPGEE